MKKILLTIAIVSFIASISCCSRCKDCTCSNNGLTPPFTSEVCREDFNSSEEYRDFIEHLESIDCDCK